MCLHIDFKSLLSLSCVFLFPEVLCSLTDNVFHFENLCHSISFASFYTDHSYSKQKPAYHPHKKVHHRGDTLSHLLWQHCHSFSGLNLETQAFIVVSHDAALRADNLFGLQEIQKHQGSPLSYPIVHISLQTESCVLNLFFGKEFICCRSISSWLHVILTPVHSGNIITSNDAIQEHLQPSLDSACPDKFVYDVLSVSVWAFVGLSLCKLWEIPT